MSTITLTDLQQKFDQELIAATTSDAVLALKIAYLGKKGLVTDAFSAMKTLDNDAKKAFGQSINDLKNHIEAKIESKMTVLEAQRLSEKLKTETIDVTLPGRDFSAGSLHPVTQILSRIERIFLAMGFVVGDGPEIEDDYHNFGALNFAEHHPARLSHDTFYFDDGRLLRTHTSPVQIRYMLENKPPVRMIAPGKVYRCDYDVTHSPMFHQVEGLVIDGETNFSDLKGLLTYFLKSFFEKELKVRFRPSYFPFTEPSCEIDISCVICDGAGCRVCKNTGWLEVLGAGMVHPAVLSGVGLDPEKEQGFAFGMGVERLAMLYYQIDDLRLFFENEDRFLKQFAG